MAQLLCPNVMTASIAEVTSNYDIHHRLSVLGRKCGLRDLSLLTVTVLADKSNFLEYEKNVFPVPVVTLA